LIKRQNIIKMKKIILSLFIVFSITCGHSQTNVYQPFPFDSLVYTSMTESGSSMGSSWLYEKTMWLGDTLINSTHYTKCYRNQTNFNWDGVPSTYYGGMRQDTANEKAYFIDLTNTEHDISVSQNLNVGDSLNGLPITSIDSVLCGTKYHKQYNMAGFDSVDMGNHTARYVVGIGIKNYSNTYFEHGDSYGIYCYTVKNENYFGMFPAPCNILAGVFENTNPTREINLFPNPARDFIILSIPSPQSNMTVTIFNTFGETVLKTNFQNGESAVSIDVRTLPAGIYFIKANTFSSKFIKS
ncbi:MAG: T9SS type A sorting domain-containing protein, partial [Bacteroidota bacterium]